MTARLSRSRRVTSTARLRAGARLGADAGHADGLALIERRQVELELGVLHGVGGEHVHAERGHAPLHPLAHVPHVALAGAPRREVAREPGLDVGEQAPAEELVGALAVAVAVRARVIALAHAPAERGAPALERGALLGALQVELHR